MSILQTIDLRKYYGTEPNITKALDLSLIHIQMCIRDRSYIVAWKGVVQDDKIYMRNKKPEQKI